MKILQYLSFVKKTWFILTLILVVFLLKGALLAVLHPIFVGQDEARHYSTIQYINEPKEKNWPVDKRTHIKDKHSIKDYNFSQEIVETGLATDLDIIREENYNTMLFSGSYAGRKEGAINSNHLKKINEFYYPDIAPPTAYHYLGAIIESFFSKENVFVRFYLIRLFSVILGAFSLLIYYFAAKNIGLSEKNSLLLTAIISFQPRFSIYYVSINYDALLILSFALFSLGGILALRSGINWKNTAIMLSAIFLGMLTKGTSLVLLVVFLCLLAISFYLKAKGRKLSKRKIIIPAILVATVLFIAQTLFDISKTLFSFDSELFPGALASFQGYLAKSLTFTRFDMMIQTYWGNLSWSINSLYKTTSVAIWIVEIIAVIGIGLFIFSKRKVDFLPEKKYIFFLLAMMMTLQLSIRFYDWQIFAKTGGLNLGTPGRYFIPNIFSHFVIIFTAMGFLLRKKKYFNGTILVGLVLMFIFSIYLIIDVIMPRFYL